MIDDLTWQQLQTAIAVNNAITVSGGKVVIDVSLVTGDTIGSLSDKGVIEFCHKLLNAAYKAQTAANQNIATGQRLNSFSQPIFGSIAIDQDGNSRLTITRQVTALVELDQDNPVGINI
jgi:hypothetical protein